jgi:hypothetical protein
MIGSAASVLLRGAVLAALISAFFAGSAHAGPAWLFNGVIFSEGTETVVGDAVLGTFTVSGISVVCKKTHYEMSISNGAKGGQASMNSLLFTTCTATSPCTVEAVEAESFPWPSNLGTVSGQHYFVVKKVDVTVYFGSGNCALAETAMPITGSAGALYDNPTEAFTFSPASFAATGTKLVAFGFEVQWAAAFTTEATEFHNGEALTVG